MFARYSSKHTAQNIKKRDNIICTWDFSEYVNVEGFELFVKNVRFKQGKASYSPMETATQRNSINIFEQILTEI